MQISWDSNKKRGIKQEETAPWKLEKGEGRNTKARTWEALTALVHWNSFFLLDCGRVPINEMRRIVHLFHGINYSSAVLPVAYVSLGIGYYNSRLWVLTASIQQPNFYWSSKGKNGLIDMIEISRLSIQIFAVVEKWVKTWQGIEGSYLHPAKIIFRIDFFSWKGVSSRAKLLFIAKEQFLAIIQTP